VTLAEAARALARGRVSATELVAESLAAIADWQPHLNAFLKVDARGARRAAQASDRRRRAGRARSALDGVPLAHKDLFERAGRVMSAGSIILDKPATATARALRHLDAAGLLDIGQLHLSEFAAGATGHNRHFGDCRNPWNIARIPGGSSGGSAAAVATGLVSASLGTDTGGSVRLPAHFCGVTALRPTQDLIDVTGVFPRSWAMDTVGPIARTALDVGLLFGLIGGTPGRGGDVTGLRIGVPRTFFLAEVEQGIGRLLDAALRDLRRAGARIVPVDVPDPRPLFDLAQTVAQAEAATIHGPWLDTRRDDYDTGIVLGMLPGRKIAATEYLAALHRRAVERQAWVTGPLAKADLLFVPVYDHPTPSVDESRPDSGDKVASVFSRFGRCTRPFSYLGLPALAVPCGFQPDGMPAAFQLVGRPLDEATLLRVGRGYQRGTDWHRARPALPA